MTILLEPERPWAGGEGTNRRLIYRFENGNAYDVWLIDYH
jgi:hypothetical protein